MARCENVRADLDAMFAAAMSPLATAFLTCMIRMIQPRVTQRSIEVNIYIFFILHIYETFL